MTKHDDGFFDVMASPEQETAECLGWRSTPSKSVGPGSVREVQEGRIPLRVSPSPSRVAVSELLEEAVDLTRKASRIVPNETGTCLQSYSAHERLAVEALMKRVSEICRELTGSAG